MNKKIQLKVKTLGGFEMSDGHSIYPSGNRRRMQVDLLIAYLVMNRQQHISVSQLIDFLWPDGNSDKPEGALRNLIYRARLDLEDFLPGSNCIQSKGHRYFFNPDIECQVDYEELMRLSEKIIHNDSNENLFEDCIAMVEYLHSGFLRTFINNHWVEVKNQELEENCIQAILKTLSYLSEHDNHQEILTITTHPALQRIIDSRLYEHRLFAYYATGQIDMALSFYRQIVDHYYSQYGIEVTPRIKEIYQFILDRMPSEPINVSELENTLMKDEDADKTFYCDFDVFKNIYQVNLRSVRRSMKARVLVLLTLVDTANELTNSSIQEESTILKQVISSSLRKNDIFSKFNVSQYSLIVASPNLEGAKKAVERIVERYQAKKKHQDMILQTELKIID